MKQDVLHIVKPMPLEMKLKLQKQRKIAAVNEMIRKELKTKNGKPVMLPPAYPNKKEIWLPEGFTGSNLKELKLVNQILRTK